MTFSIAPWNRSFYVHACSMCFKSTELWFNYGSSIHLPKFLEFRIIADLCFQSLDLMIFRKNYPAHFVQSPTFSKCTTICFVRLVHQ